MIGLRASLVTECLSQRNLFDIDKLFFTRQVLEDEYIDQRSESEI